MTHKKSTLLAQLTIGLVAIALTAVAILRGNYLFGLAGAFPYSLASAGLIAMFAQSFKRKGKAAGLQVIAVTLVAVPIGYVLAFPAEINPDVQIFIDMQATNRSVRAELKRVFKSDPAFGDLSTFITHLKVVNVTICGVMPAREDMRRLRKRIADECPTLELCLLHWNVRLLATADKRT